MKGHRGAFKTPGGKLVAVDLAVEDGKLRNVQVHGDFFLYPEETIDAISGAIDGAPADISDEDLTKRISSAIPDGTEWLGSSPQALTNAVRRALESPAEEIETAGGGTRGWS
jgi:lipoate-protein ligase A